MSELNNAAASVNPSASANASATTKELVCISCPRGCRLVCTEENGKISVTGNSCARGPVYAEAELTHPTRVLTVLIRPEGAKKPVSVKTDKPVPKELLFQCAEAIYSFHPQLPIKRGDILMENLLGTGCNVIATRSAE